MRLDSIPFGELNVRWLRQTVGVVPQELVVFGTSVENNLRLGKEDADQGQMEAACRLANAHDFVRGLPEGYRTAVGEGGVKLSGGQKQRLAIARTLLRNPRILLLDEATSALDAENERAVQAAMDAACRGRTTVVVAHRLSTVANADRILVFSGGRLVEQGGFAQLLQQGGVFARMVRDQEVRQPAERPSDSLTPSGTDASLSDTASGHSELQLTPDSLSPSPKKEPPQ